MSSLRRPRRPRRRRRRRPPQHLGHRPLRPSAAGTPTIGGRILASPNARRVAAERGVRLSTVRGSGPGGRIVSEDVPEVPFGGPADRTREIRPLATFAARTLADLLGVDLTEVPVDPVDQRVTREGVAAYVRSLLQQLASPPRSSPAALVASMPLLQQPTEVIKLSGMRGTIARRMHASLQEIAQLTLTMDADMTAVLADRAERSGWRDGPAPSITDYVVAATARALDDESAHQRPGHRGGHQPAPERSTSAWRSPSTMVSSSRSSATRPQRRLADLAGRDEAARRRGSPTAQLSPADLEGGTFSVSALGTFGVDAVHAGDQPAERRNPRRRPAPRRRRRRRRRGDLSEAAHAQPDLGPSGASMACPPPTSAGRSSTCSPRPLASTRAMSDDRRRARHRSSHQRSPRLVTFRRGRRRSGRTRRGVAGRR